MMKERWKDIEDYKGYYQVSNTGRVRSIGRDVPFRGGVVEHIPGTLLKPGVVKKRNSLRNQTEVQVHLYWHRHGHMYSVSRLVAEAFVPNPHNYPYVYHKDDDSTNNRADNLAWGTPYQITHYGDHLKHSWYSIRTYCGRPVIACKGSVRRRFSSQYECARFIKRHARSSASLRSIHSEIRSCLRPNGHIHKVKGYLIYPATSRGILMTRHYSKSVKSLPHEIWKGIPELRDLYQVSSMGRIKATANSAKYFHAEHLIKIKKHPRYEDRFSPHISSHRRPSFKVSHLVARAFVPNPHRWKYVTHRNGHIHDNRMSNLEWLPHDYGMIEKNRRAAQKTTRLTVLDKGHEQKAFSSVARAAQWIKAATGAGTSISSLESELSVASSRHSRVRGFSVTVLEKRD